MTNELNTASTAEQHLDGGPIRLRYATRCSGCGQTLQPRTTAHYDRTLKQTFCVEHAPVVAPAVTEWPAPALAVRVQPAQAPHTTSGAQPAHGSPSFGRVLDALAADGRIEVLHDRVTSASRSADHIVIGNRRITVICVLDGDHDATGLIDELRHQCADVLAAVGHRFGQVVDGILTYADQRHGRLDPPAIGDVTCMDIDDAVARVSFGGWLPGNSGFRFDASDRAELRDLIAATFPAV